MEEFIKSLPKAELHVHFGGCVQPDLICKLAQRNRIDIGLTLQQIHQKFSHYQGLLDFINSFDLSTSVIHTAQDIYEIAIQYYKSLHSQGVKYAQMTISSILKDRFFNPTELMEGLIRASEEAQSTLDLKVKYILSAIRHRDPQLSNEMIKQFLPYKDHIVAIGLVGAQAGHRARKFKQVFEEGKKITENLSLHAGQEGDPVSVMDALFLVNAKRIDHGVRALQDPFLCQFLKEAEVPLTVCPVSNRRLQVLSKNFGGNHVIKQMLNLGLKVSINSDDPALFGADLVGNFMEILQQLGPDQRTQKETIKELCINSFQGSFLPESEKEKFINMIKEF